MAETENGEKGGELRTRVGVWFAGFPISGFVLVSDFGFRYSDLISELVIAHWSFGAAAVPANCSTPPGDFIAKAWTWPGKRDGPH